MPQPLLALLRDHECPVACQSAAADADIIGFAGFKRLAIIFLIIAFDWFAIDKDAVAGIFPRLNISIVLDQIPFASAIQFTIAFSDVNALGTGGLPVLTQHLEYRGTVNRVYFDLCANLATCQ